MAYNIGTVLHRALEVANREPLIRMQSLPHMVFHKELMALFDDMSIQKSVQAMMRAGVGHLPFPTMVAELWLGLNWRVLIEMHEQDGAIVCEVVEFIMDRVNPYDMYLKITFHEKISPTANRLKGVVPKDGDDAHGAWKVQWAEHKSMNKREDLVRHVVAALNLTLLSSHVSELDREVIEPTRLNKARVKAGKPRIPTHTVVRIGHVYTKTGERVRVSDANRRSMSIHMRAGHTRRQQHGQQWRDEHPELAHMPFFEEDHHPAWIAPVLVNYRDGTDLPAPLPKLVKL